MTVNELIEKAKAGGGFGSDYALANALGVSRSAVSEWRQGKRHPDAVNCEKLAVFSGFPLHRVLGIVGEARAISAAEKKVWRKLAAALVVGFVVAFPTVQARENPTNGHSACTLCEVLQGCPQAHGLGSTVDCHPPAWRLA